MNLDTFFEKFDPFADAPNAVATMRELILLLSVRGNLSEQFGSESCEAQLSAARCLRIAKRRQLNPNRSKPHFRSQKAGAGFW